MAKLSPPRGVKLATAHRPHDPPASSQYFRFVFSDAKICLANPVSYNELGMNDRRRTRHSVSALATPARRGASVRHRDHPASSLRCLSAERAHCGDRRVGALISTRATPTTAYWALRPSGVMTSPFVQHRVDPSGAGGHSSRPGPLNAAAADQGDRPVWRCEQGL